MKSALWILVALIVIGLAAILAAMSTDDSPGAIEIGVGAIEQPSARQPARLSAPRSADVSSFPGALIENADRTIIDPRSDASPTIPSIVGTVKNHELIPLVEAKVEVAIEIDKVTTVLGETVTGSDGSYSLEIPGVEEFLRYDFAIMVTAGASEYSMQTRRAGLQSRERKLWRVSFNLPAGKDVRGIVVDQAGEPVVDAEVMVLRESSHSGMLSVSSPKAKTWSSGGFRLDVPLNSRVRLLATHPRFGMGVVDAGHVDDLEGEIVEIVLVPMKLAGIVRDPAGAPVANLRIRVAGRATVADADSGERLRFTYLRSTSTDDRGRFELLDLWPGSATLETRTDRYVRNKEFEPYHDPLRKVDDRGNRAPHVLIGPEDNVVDLEYTAIRLTVALDFESEGAFSGSIRVNDLAESRFSGNRAVRWSDSTGERMPIELTYYADPGAVLSIDGGEQFESIENFVVPPAPFEQRLVLRAR